MWKFLQNKKNVNTATNNILGFDVQIPPANYQALYFPTTRIFYCDCA
jgi:hypothetical protein